MNDNLEMSVSQVFSGSDGGKYAFVYFTDGDRTAEGRIPECRVISNIGFSADEEKALEAYMKGNLDKLKDMSGSVNVMSAFMK